MKIMTKFTMKIRTSENFLSEKKKRTVNYETVSESLKRLIWKIHLFQSSQLHSLPYRYTD